MSGSKMPPAKGPVPGRVWKHGAKAKQRTNAIGTKNKAEAESQLQSLLFKHGLSTLERCHKRSVLSTNVQWSRERSRTFAMAVRPSGDSLGKNSTMPLEERSQNSSMNVETSLTSTVEVVVPVSGLRVSGPTACRPIKRQKTWKTIADPTERLAWSNDCDIDPTVGIGSQFEDILAPNLRNVFPIAANTQKRHEVVAGQIFALERLRGK